MRKTLTALLAATTLGVAGLPTSAEARWGWGWGGFGVGLATGAIVAGAGPYYPYYGYGYGYYTRPTIRDVTRNIARDITATTTAVRNTTVTMGTSAIGTGVTGNRATRSSIRIA